MDCDVIRDLLPLYADGQASDSSRRVIEEHTAVCPGCQKLLKQMRAPIEPEPEDGQQRILEKLRKKQRRKNAIRWLTVLLAVLVAVGAVLAASSRTELLYAASTDKEKILKEMPALALTQEELALAQTILEIPLVREAMSRDAQNAITLDAAFLPELSGILPENGRFADILVIGPSIGISIVAGNQYTYLTYGDSDLTGHIDVITKTVALSSLEEIGEDGFLGDVDAVYELIYAVGTEFAQYSKLKTRPVLFDFLGGY